MGRVSRAMKIASLLWCLPLALGAVSAACGSDGDADGDGDAADDGGLSLDPGREVEGCFDCSDDEYCLLVVRGGDLYFCAPTPSCGEACSCLIPDSEERHAECYSSCQEDSGMVYCAREL